MAARQPGLVPGSRSHTSSRQAECLSLRSMKEERETETAASRIVPLTLSRFG
jgi:hypothetical protein